MFCPAGNVDSNIGDILLMRSIGAIDVLGTLTRDDMMAAGL